MMTRAAILLAMSASLIAARPQVDPQEPPVSLVAPRAPLTTGTPEPPPPPADKIKEVKCADLSQGAMWIPNDDTEDRSKTSHVGFMGAASRACYDAIAQQHENPDQKHFDITVQKYIKQAGVLSDISQCPTDDPSTQDKDESVGDEMDFGTCYQVWLSDGVYGKLQLSIDISAGGYVENCYDMVYGAFNPDNTDNCAGTGRSNFNGKDTHLGTVLTESGAFYSVNATRV